MFCRVLVLLFLSLLLSCEEPSEFNPDNLIGTWILEYIEYNRPAPPKKKSGFLNESVKISGITYRDVFLEDGSGYVYISSDYYDAPADTFYFRWKLNDRVLAISTLNNYSDNEQSRYWNSRIIIFLSETSMATKEINKYYFQYPKDMKFIYRKETR